MQGTLTWTRNKILRHTGKQKSVYGSPLQLHIALASCSEGGLLLFVVAVWRSVITQRAEQSLPKMNLTFRFGVESLQAARALDWQGMLS